MKRGTLLLAAAATAVAALAVSPSGAVPHEPNCAPVAQGTFLETPEVRVGSVTVVTHSYHGFKYCGYHWASVPIHYRVDTTGMPAIQNTTSANRAILFTDAAKAAAAEWSAWWPLNPTPSQGCSGSKLLCYDATTSDVVIKFAAPGALPTGVLGRTYVCSPGIPNCPTPPPGAGSFTIYSVVLLLNPSVTWRIATAQEATLGELPGISGSPCGSLCGSWHDVQNVLTAELGHVIGLDGVGNEEACGADLIEALDYPQTMYGCFKTGDTSKRSLAWGDQLALIRLSRDY